MTHTEQHHLPAHQLGGGTAEVVVHGHFGRPVLWFPSEAGSPHDFAGNGLLDALRGPIDAGRLTVFCVPSYDSRSWSATWKPLGDRAKAHLAYEDWILWNVVHRLAESLRDKQIPHDLFVWGPQWPHDWPSWRAQAAHYLSDLE